MADDIPGIDLGIDGLGPAEHIGRGGFADVYRAEQLSLRRTVAVKVLRGQARTPEADARFQRECHAIGAVSDHPHIVAVHHGGLTSNGRAYLVMEYLSGGSLAERLDERGVLPVQEVVETTAKIARALAVAHRAGILHRDVKPGNIMISSYGEPALGDFGIARIEGGHQTTTGLVNASIVHAAPEVLEGHKPSPAADIYSLGSTIFELLVGRAPYYDPADESVWPVMKRILSEPMPDPEAAGMSPGLAAVFRRATARIPTDRYQDADQMADDLQALLDDPRSLVLRAPDPARVAVGPPPEPDRTPTVAVDQTVLTPMPTGAPSSRPDVTAVQGPPPTPTLPTTAPVMTPPPSVAPTRRAGDVPAAVGAFVVALAAVGAAVWFLLLPALDDGTDVDAEVGTRELRIEGADLGPLQAGTGYPVEVAQPTADERYRLILDGEAQGEPSQSIPDLIAPAGRHRVVVEVSSSDGVEPTAPIDFIALVGPPTSGFRVDLARLPASADRWSELIGVFDALEAQGHDDLQVVATDGLDGVAGGAWLITVTGFEDAERAEAYCQEFDLSVPDRCYAAPVSPTGS